jgi:hypothetical protein
VGAQNANGIYDPKWLPCRDRATSRQALAFAVHVAVTTPLIEDHYRQIFSSRLRPLWLTWANARLTYDKLRMMGVTTGRLTKLAGRALTGPARWAALTESSHDLCYDSATTHRNFMTTHFLALCVTAWRLRQLSPPPVRAPCWLQSATGGTASVRSATFTKRAATSRFLFLAWSAFQASREHGFHLHER